MNDDGRVMKEGKQIATQQSFKKRGLTIANAGSMGRVGTSFIFFKLFIDDDKIRPGTQRSGDKLLCAQHLNPGSIFRK